jgi:hypothetical protein
MEAANSTRIVKISLDDEPVENTMHKGNNQNKDVDL